MRKFKGSIDFISVLLIVAIIMSVSTIYVKVSGSYYDKETRSFVKITNEQKAERLTEEQEELLKEQKR